MLSRVISKKINKCRVAGIVASSVPKANFHSSKPLNEIITVRDSVRIAMCDEMRKDPNVFLMGEEVGEY